MCCECQGPEFPAPTKTHAINALLHLRRCIAWLPKQKRKWLRIQKKILERYPDLERYAYKGR